jgi:hypothetical protein
MRSPELALLIASCIVGQFPGTSMVAGLADTNVSNRIAEIIAESSKNKSGTEAIFFNSTTFAIFLRRHQASTFFQIISAHI